MDKLPQINDGLWIILFIIAGVLGYKLLIKRMTEKKVVPSYLFVFGIKTINDMQQQITYEVGATSLIKIIAHSKTGESSVLLEKEQKPGNYFLNFDTTNIKSISVVSDKQTIERYL